MKILNLIAGLITLATGTSVLADKPSIHGMFLFGDQVTYASHLPMYHAPHDYQVVFKLSLQDRPNSQTLNLYTNAKRAGNTFFTLVPERLDLSKLINGTRTSFTAEIYDGHFEKGGKNLGSVSVGVEKVVFSKRLNPSEASSTPEEYLLFGGSTEYFVVHIVTGKPSFDSVLKSSQPYILNPPVCHEDACTEPAPSPIAGSKLPMKLTGSKSPQKGDILGDPSTGAVDIQQVLYWEDEDLIE